MTHPNIYIDTPHSPVWVFFVVENRAFRGCQGCGRIEFVSVKVHGLS